MGNNCTNLLLSFFTTLKMYSTIETGSKYSKSYKCYITKDNKIISPWHDINLFNNDRVMCINEIPKFTNAKFEINKSVPCNPILQDIKKDIPRFVSNIFPLKGYPWNYGALPQTWENKNEILIDNYKGDNDPLDIIEIGPRKEIGEVYEAKVLGCLALVDDGEIDWKIIVVDSKFEMFNDIDDIEKHCPGLLDTTRFWFENYKIPDGKGKNVFAMEGKFMNKEFAMKIIKEAHESYKGLMESKCETDFSYCKGEEFKEEIVQGKEADSGVHEKVNDYYFIK